MPGLRTAVLARSLQNGLMVRPTQTLNSISGATPEGFIPPPGDWQTDTPVPILKNVLRFTAPNPGVMTGPGTNSYLVGDVQTGFIVIDPGPADADHIERLWRAAMHVDGSGGNIHSIVCTHSHPDHAPGARPLQALCAEGDRPLVLGMSSAPTARAASAFTPDRELRHGEELRLQREGASHSHGTRDAHTLRVIHTPGHAANHICLLLVEDGMLFSGDHVLNGSTTVVDPPDGNMADYIDSLDLLHTTCVSHGASHILPAHGHVITDAIAAIAALKAHRLRREAKIAGVMQSNPQGGPDEWLPLAYDDVPPRLWPVAKRSLLAHVERITALQSR